MTLVIAAAQSTSTAGNIAENVARHLRFCAVAAEHGVQLLVFPELSLTGYDPAIARSNAVRPDAAVLDPLRRLAAQANMTVVAGAPLWNDKHELNIAAFAFRPYRAMSIYTKVYLGSGEEEVFAPGLGAPVLSVDEAKVALAICADITHPEHAAAAAQAAHVYAAGVLVTKQLYPRDTTFLRNYALQHKMAVLMANHSGASEGSLVSAGKSAIWSEDGRLVAASPGTEDALVVATRRNDLWTGTVLPVPLHSAAAQRSR
jgi:predicted amidohydrolase